MTQPAPGTRAAPAGNTFLDRLAARSAATGTVLCLGLDPDPATLPPGFEPGVSGVEAFARLILDAALPFAAAIKPNLAFYEAFGSAGLAALERLRRRVPSDVPVVLDAKRADIGSTAARQAVALFDALGAPAELPRAWHSSCPGWGPRAVTRRPSWGMARLPRRRLADGAAEDSWSAFRGR